MQRNNVFTVVFAHQTKIIKRYRMTVDEIMETVYLISETGMTTVVLQSGEAPGP
jgi:2-iminoacetate synthase ThiH